MGEEEPVEESISKGLNWLERIGWALLGRLVQQLLLFLSRPSVSVILGQEDKAQESLFVHSALFVKDSRCSPPPLPESQAAGDIGAAASLGCLLRPTDIVPRGAW